MTSDGCIRNGVNIKSQQIRTNARVRGYGWMREHGTRAKKINKSNVFCRRRVVQRGRGRRESIQN